MRGKRYTRPRSMKGYYAFVDNLVREAEAAAGGGDGDGSIDGGSPRRSASITASITGDTGGNVCLDDGTRGKEDGCGLGDARTSTSTSTSTRTNANSDITTTSSSSSNSSSGSDASSIAGGGGGIHGSTPGADALFGTVASIDDVTWQQELLTESIFLQLRTAEGISLQEVKDSFGLAAALALRDAAKVYIASGHLKPFNHQRGSGCDVNAPSAGNAVDDDNDVATAGGCSRRSSSISAGGWGAIQLAWPDGYLLEHSISFALVCAVEGVIDGGGDS